MTDRQITLNDLLNQPQLTDVNACKAQNSDNVLIDDDTLIEPTTASDHYVKLRENHDNNVYIELDGGYRRYHLLSKKHIRDIKERNAEAKAVREQTRMLLRDHDAQIAAQREHQIQQYRDNHYGVSARIKTLISDIQMMSESERQLLLKMLVNDQEGEHNDD
jgi:hypothetical protein